MSIITVNMWEFSNFAWWLPADFTCSYLLWPWPISKVTKRRQLQKIFVFLFLNVSCLSICGSFFLFVFLLCLVILKTVRFLLHWVLYIIFMVIPLSIVHYIYEVWSLHTLVFITFARLNALHISSLWADLYTMWNRESKEKTLHVLNSFTCIQSTDTGINWFFFSLLEVSGEKS